MDIAKSKQLLKKSKTPRNKRLTASTKKTKRNNIPKRNRSEIRPTSLLKENYNESKQPKFCSNSKPMPSLAELEKMYDGSDDEELPALPDRARSTPKQASTVQQSSKTTNVSPPIESRRYSEETDVIDLDRLKSPSTVENITRKVLHYIESLPDSSVILADNQPLAVIPPKKRKKPIVPYIVGCKDRPQKKNWVSSVVIGAGDPEYGIHPHIKEEASQDEISPKRRKKSNIPTPQYSHFNSQSEEIASKLKANDEESDSSDDSTKTVSYEYTRSFSPQPSTSKNDLIISQNEIRFNKSLKENLNQSQLSDVETITIDDEISISNDSGVQIVESNIKAVNSNNHPITTIDLDDDPYSSITDIYLDNDSAVEVIDIDDVIADHQSVLKKYKRESLINAVTLVEPITVNLIDSPVAPKTPIIKPNNPTENVKPNAKKCLDIISSFFKRNSGVKTVNLCDSIEDLSSLEYIKCLTKSLVNSFSQNVAGGSSATSSQPQTHSIQNVQPQVASGSGIATGTQNKHSTVEVAARRSYNIPEVPTPQTPQSSRANKNNKAQKKKPLLSQSPAIPNSPVQPQSIGRTIGECPICMENLSNKSIASTVCGHIFCTECIKAAVKSSGKKCPTCRKKLTGVGFHQLFL